jgi:3',5'-cyclic AMP phosphodiesterase CpdA
MPGEVFYGLGGAYDQQAVSTATGRRHEVTLSGLEPGAEYGYWIASLGYPLAAAGSFRTAPPAEAASFTFAAFGDTRSGDKAHRRIADAMLAVLPDFALHTGDLVAYGSQASEWDRFFEIEHGLLASVPLFPSPGNHEQNAARYFDAFVLPGNERWYTFEWGNARFVSLQIDAIVPFGKRSEQVQWLEATLAANTQPWLIVWFHLPPFDSYTKTDLSSAVRTNLIPLFERYHVDLVLSGHSHNYQRSNVNGITYIVTAGGGAELNPLPAAGPELEAGFSGNHFVRFQIDGTALTAQAITIDGAIVDEFTLSSIP